MEELGFTFLVKHNFKKKNYIFCMIKRLQENLNNKRQCTAIKKYISLEQCWCFEELAWLRSTSPKQRVFGETSVPHVVVWPEIRGDSSCILVQWLQQSSVHCTKPSQSQSLSLHRYKLLISKKSPKQDKLKITVNMVVKLTSDYSWNNFKYYEYWAYLLLFLTQY